MIGIIKHFRLAQRPLHSCCQLVRANIRLTPFNGAKAYWSSTLKNPNHVITPGQSASSKGSIPQKTLKKTVVLSGEAQRAVWASKVIQMILNAEDPKDIKDSLRSRLLAATIDTTSFEFDLQDEFKNQILEMFEKGKQLDETIYNQERIINAMIKEPKTRQNRLIFYPTTMVSRLVFKIIWDKYSTFLQGSFGIGKTISFVLYVELARYIHKLVYLAKGSWIPIERREKYTAELELLLQKQLIRIPPKCWYWSIKRDLQFQQRQLVELIKDQMEEYCLEGKYKQQLQETKNMSDLIPLLKTLRQKSIKPIVVVDQINSLISYFRKWNNANDQYQLAKQNKDVDNDKYKNYLKDQQLYLKPSEHAQSLLTKFAGLAPIYILNSSYQVQQDLLSPIKQSDNSRKKHLSITNHGNPNTIKLSYGKSLEKQVATTIQFNQIFQMILQQKLRQYEALPSNIQKIVSNLFSSPIQTKFYYRFLFIREYFYQTNIIEQEAKYLQFGFMRMLQTFNDFKTPQTDQYISLFFTKLKNNYYKFCIINMKVRLEQYMNKPVSKQQVQKRRLLIHCIRLRAKKLQHDKKSVLKFKVSALSNDLSLYFQKKFNIVGSFLQLSTPKNETLLPFKCSEGVIEFEWSVQDFLEISQGLDRYEVTKQTLKLLGMSHSKEFLITSRQTLGHYMEFIIAKLIQNSSSVKFKGIRVSGRGNKKIKSEIQYERKMLVNQIYFWSLNKDDQANEQGVSIHNNFKVILEQAKAKPDQCFMGTPYRKYKDSGIVARDERSISIDFILVEYNRANNIYKITTFDVTIIEKVNGKAKKARQVLEQLLRFKNKPSKSKFTIKHIIICPQQSVKNEQVVQEDLTIEYVSIQSLTFNQCRSPELQTYFEDAKNVMAFKSM